MCRVCFVAYAARPTPWHRLGPNRIAWIAESRLGLMGLLVLAWLAVPGAGLRAREPACGPAGGTARLPVQIIEKPAQQLAAEAAPCTAAHLRLQPPSRREGTADSGFRAPTAGGAVTTVLTSLAVVLGLFVLSALVLRKATGRNHAMLPGEVVQTLGRAPLSGRQEMHLVRVGNKLLLLSVTATGAETLTEITEPGEIDRLAGICRQSHPDSITASFREILWQCGQTQRV